MDVSVIIPCRNEERYITRCLEALLNQTCGKDRYEIIVVDNMSTDRTVEFARGYPQVTLIQEPKPGSYAARNTGVRLSRGRVLAFTDADCVADPDWVERIVEELSDGKTALLVGSRRFGHEGLLVSSLADYEYEKARFVYDHHDPSLYYAYTNNLAVLRETFDRYGPFMEIARGGDVVFACEVIRALGCESVRFAPSMRIRHLEIDHWYSWYHKMWLYGKSYRGYHTMTRTRPLSFRQRFTILRNAARRSRFPVLQSGLLLISGFAATVAFEAGRHIPRMLKGSTPISDVKSG